MLRVYVKEKAPASCILKLMAKSAWGLGCTRESVHQITRHVRSSGRILAEAYVVPEATKRSHNFTPALSLQSQCNMAQEPDPLPQILSPVGPSPCPAAVSALSDVLTYVKERGLSPVATGHALPRRRPQPPPQQDMRSNVPKADAPAIRQQRVAILMVTALLVTTF